MARVPKRLVDDLDSIQLTPGDRHLLSLVDGSLSEEDLAFVTGKAAAAVAEDLERLAMMGLVDFVGRRSDQPGPEAPPPASDGAAPAGTPDAAAPAPVQAVDGVELSAEEIQAIDELYGRLDRCNYYELLGVETDVSKKQIRRAYNQLARRFHPDRHFRKQLGEYKQKIERIFSRLTEAHDTLRANKRREEYDESERIERRFQPGQPADEAQAAAGTSGPPPTAPTSPSAAATASGRPPGPGAGTRSASAPSQPAPAAPAAPAPAPGSPAQQPPTQRRRPLRPAAKIRPRAPTPIPGARAGGRGEAPGATAARAVATPRPDSGVRPAPVSSPPEGRPRRASRPDGPAPGRGPSSPAMPNMDPEEAKRVRAEALKRKMASARRFSVPPPGGSRANQPPRPPSAAPAGEGSVPPPYEPPKEVEKSAAEVFRDRFQRIEREARTRRCERYVAQAKAAYSRGDYRLAAEAYRLASELSGNDPQLRELAEEAAERASRS